jgi:hemoglobin
MQDIKSREDIVVLVDRFYKQLLVDAQLGEFFTRIVPIKWEVHMPIMYSFWESTLLGKQSYKGNPMLVHLKLHSKKALTKSHFERWLLLWEQNISALYEGEKANDAIRIAKQIGSLMEFKVNQQG